jgi:hypothetical protein
MSILLPLDLQMALGNEYLNAEYQLLAWYYRYYRISIKYSRGIQLTTYMRCYASHVPTRALPVVTWKIISL